MSLSFFHSFFSAPAVASDVSTSEASYDLCLSITFAPAYEREQEAMCACAAENWDSRPPGYDVFLWNYGHHYAASDGDRPKAEQLTAEQMGMDLSDVSGQVSIMIGELANVALAWAE